jgi:hypothetical protein
MRKILNFKILNFASVILVITLLSCNAGDCTNGIQDGNETGIDCGGNCSACVTTPPPGGGNNAHTSCYNTDLVGTWYLQNIVYLEHPDYVSEIEPNCQLQLLEFKNSSSINYKSYGQIFECNLTPDWWCYDEIQHALSFENHGYYLIQELTPNTLTLKTSGGEAFIYYTR